MRFKCACVHACVYDRRRKMKIKMLGLESRARMEAHTLRHCISFIPSNSFQYLFLRWKANGVCLGPLNVCVRRANDDPCRGEKYALLTKTITWHAIHYNMATPCAPYAAAYISLLNQRRVLILGYAPKKKKQKTEENREKKTRTNPQSISVFGYSLYSTRL